MLKAPLFRHSRSEYFFDKDSNVIYQGLGSIKYMSVDVAEELYSMREQQFSNFIDFLFARDTMTHKLDSRQLDILVKIGYFAEFGPAKALLEGIKIFNLFAKSKTIKIDKLADMGYNVDTIKPYCGKVTEKTLSDLDNRGIILAILRSMQMPKTTVIDMAKWQIEHLGYCNFSDPRRDVNDYLVLNVQTTGYGGKFLKIYNLCYGAERTYKVNKQWAAKHDCKAGDVIKVVLEDKPKWKKLDNGDFVKTGETEVQIKCFKVIE